MIGPVRLAGTRPAVWGAAVDNAPDEAAPDEAAPDPGVLATALDRLKATRCAR